MNKTLFDAIPGRKLNSRCPLCRKGRLRPVANHVSGDNGIMGPSGSSWDYHTLDHLACNHCSASFEAELKIHGINIEKTITDQLERFVNPTKKPSTCRACGNAKLTADEEFEPDYRYGPITEYGVTTHYFYCLGCLKVYWVKKTVKHPPLTDQEKRDRDSIKTQIEQQLADHKKTK